MKTPETVIPMSRVNTHIELSWNKGDTQVAARVKDGRMKPVRDYNGCEIVLHSR